MGSVGRKKGEGDRGRTLSRLEPTRDAVEVEGVLERREREEKSAQVLSDGWRKLRFGGEMVTEWEGERRGKKVEKLARLVARELTVPRTDSLGSARRLSLPGRS